MRVGDYVRTKKGIAKIIDRINDPTNYYNKFWVCDRYLELNDDTEYIHEQDIIGEPKEKIIDLIKVGDYVNGSKVLDIAQAPKKAIYTEQENGGALLPIVNNRIESILTKEQFESCMYKVGE